MLCVEEEDERKKNECTKIQNVYYIFDIIGVDFKYTRPSS